MVLAAVSLGAEAVGFEISLLPYVLAQIRRFFSKNKDHCEILYRNFWPADLSDADVVYFFLMPKIHKKLGAILKEKLKKGAKVITYTWPIEGWTPTKAEITNKGLSFYLYQI